MKTTGEESGNDVWYECFKLRRGLLKLGRVWGGGGGGEWYLSSSRHQQNLDIAVYVDIASLRGI